MCWDGAEISGFLLVRWLAALDAAGWLVRMELWVRG